ncbi:hypothetical protein HMPREF0972_00777 [Actinomyces sp. oral taxon 848 str. F0332]|nr:hypothetical protein HMPREF0972_00777 [Actinomyces sp. oral taxon 848 str. F0332]
MHWGIAADPIAVAQPRSRTRPRWRSAVVAAFDKSLAERALEKLPNPEGQ